METLQTDPTTVLLLGDPECGKSTFLSHLSSNPRLQSGRQNPHGTHQPYSYTTTFPNQTTLTLDFYDTASPNQHWTTLDPDVVVLSFDISSRDSLSGLKAWRDDITRYFQHGHREDILVMILGLKRDLRGKGEAQVVYPQESYRIAQELRCDRYAECSALTGELVDETVEDILKLAVGTRTNSSREGCIIS